VAEEQAKAADQAAEAAQADETKQAEAAPKRGRGRPPKNQAKKPKRRLTPKALEGDFQPDAEGKKYHYGFMPSSPIHNFVLKGVSFNRETWIPGGTAGGQHKYTNGIITRLSENKVEAVLDAVQHFIVRPRVLSAARIPGEIAPREDEPKEKVAAEVMDTRVSTYRRAREDEPLAYHIYMVGEDHKDFHSGFESRVSIGEMYAD